MKYIKTYEISQIYKKYAIMSHVYRLNRLFIYSLMNYTSSDDETVLTMRRLYEYNTKTSELIFADNDIYYFKITDTTGFILYQTDSLDDAKDTIKMIADTKKYNL